MLNLEDMALTLGMRPKQGVNVLVWVLFSKLKSEFPFGGFPFNNLVKLR
jgi:apolipoprotein N-acyltransferase